MKRKYDNISIQFDMDHYHFCAQNIVFEQFQQPIPRHSHSANIYEIHFIPYGYGEVWAGDQHFYAKANTLFMTGPNIEHEQKPDPRNPMAEYCVFFRVTPEKGYTGHASTAASIFYQTKLWHGVDTQHINQLMTLLFEELDQNMIGYLENIETLLRALVISMARNYRYEKASVSKQQSSAPSLESRTQIMLDEAFLYDCGTLTLEELADKLGLSPRQTQRLLKQQYDMSFQQKKTSSRMSLAYSLLTTTTLSITDISAKLGYSSIEHFSSAFRKYTGISPLSYREGARIR